VARIGERSTGFWWGDLRERGRLEELGVDERIILKWMFKNWNYKGMDWIAMLEDRDR
jgi:hypothetical protein